MLYTTVWYLMELTWQPPTGGWKSPEEKGEDLCLCKDK